LKEKFLPTSQDGRHNSMTPNPLIYQFYQIMQEERIFFPIFKFISN